MNDGEGFDNYEGLGAPAPTTVDKVAEAVLKALIEGGLDVEQTEERLDGFTFLVSTDSGDFWLVLDEA